jgi:hypothetical protein
MEIIRDIQPEYWVALGHRPTPSATWHAAVSILSLLVPGFLLIYVRRSAKASREQTNSRSRPPKMFVATTGRAKGWCCCLETPGQALLVT